MKKLFILASIVGTLLPGAANAQQQVILSIRAANGQFLGILTPDTYNDESLCNRYGNYGSRYSDTSIFNRYGDYGSQYSDLSAYNSRAKTPPALFNGSVFMGLVTKNANLRNAMDPDAVKAIVCKQ